MDVEENDGEGFNDDDSREYDDDSYGYDGDAGEECCWDGCDEPHCEDYDYMSEDGPSNSPCYHNDDFSWYGITDLNEMNSWRTDTNWMSPSMEATKSIQFAPSK